MCNVVTVCIFKWSVQLQCLLVFPYHSFFKGGGIRSNHQGHCSSLAAGTNACARTLTQLGTVLNCLRRVFTKMDHL